MSSILRVFLFQTSVNRQIEQVSGKYRTPLISRQHKWHDMTWHETHDKTWHDMTYFNWYLTQENLYLRFDNQPTMECYHTHFYVWTDLIFCSILLRSMWRYCVLASPAKENGTKGNNCNEGKLSTNTYVYVPMLPEGMKLCCTPCALVYCEEWPYPGLAT